MNIFNFSLLETCAGGGSEGGVDDGDGHPDATLETLEREAKVQKKFSYHQDSMKRYKKQLSRNADVVERKISEELAEGQTC